MSKLKITNMIWSQIKKFEN